MVKVMEEGRVSVEIEENQQRKIKKKGGRGRTESLSHSLSLAQGRLIKSHDTHQNELETRSQRTGTEYGKKL